MEIQKQLPLPKLIFPFRSVSKRLALDYNEMDEWLDILFADLFAVQKETTAEESIPEGQS